MRSIIGGPFRSVLAKPTSNTRLISEGAKSRTRGSFDHTVKPTIANTPATGQRAACRSPPPPPDPRRSSAMAPMPQAT